MVFDDATSHIGADPFVTAVEARAPGRRLRGRLAAPVTVWTTATTTGASVGITISSVLVAEAEPPEVLGLVDPLSVFFDTVGDSGRFVLHVLTAEQARLAEAFALRFPGDPFEGQAMSRTPWGPALDSVTTRAGCAVIESWQIGYSRLVRARVEDIVLDERATGPLVRYRGNYASVGARGN